jgi:hypothetical protein
VNANEPEIETLITSARGSAANVAEAVEGVDVVETLAIVVGILDRPRRVVVEIRGVPRRDVTRIRTSPVAVDGTTAILGAPPRLGVQPRTADRALDPHHPIDVAPEALLARILLPAAAEHIVVTGRARGVVRVRRFLADLDATPRLALHPPHAREVHPVTAAAAGLPPHRIPHRARVPDAHLAASDASRTMNIPAFELGPAIGCQDLLDQNIQTPGTALMFARTAPTNLAPRLEAKAARHDTASVAGR